MVGANNAGKSTVIEALRAVTQQQPPSITQGRRNQAIGDRVEIRVVDESGRNTVLKSIRSGGSETEYVKHHGLAATLEWLAPQARKHHGANVSVDADSSANPKAIDVRVFLFQAVRELLLNAVKHAPGSPMHITMKGIESGKLRVIVSDRGPGFDPTKLDRQGIQLSGLGLFSIRERMASFGGELQIKSAPGHGTRITLIAPRD